MWNAKPCVVTVIIGSTETIPRSVRNYMKDMSGMHDIKGLQKNTRTHIYVHIPRKVLT
jgi:hypothetical protein